ncbi:SUKH-4 family immunity protein [Streptomyces sp. NPDC057136]|uniref:SUKH-4 family immunity protein n=1 Tax=Streptomyces sp. NPDC057136 TaxID=3346029 RepID=UPI003626190D
MEHSISTDEIIHLFGVQGIVFSPRDEQAATSGESSSMRFLHEVGLPHDDVFLSRIDTTDPSQDSALLGEALAQQDRPSPPEVEKWLILGYFLDSFLVLDPVSEQVYAFPEGTDRYFPVHRDVESLVYALCALQEFHLARKSAECMQALAEDMRSKIEDVDELPFTDPLSEWNIIYEEILEGTW